MSCFNGAEHVIDDVTFPTSEIGVNNEKDQAIENLFSEGGFRNFFEISFIRIQRLAEYFNGILLS